MGQSFNKGLGAGCGAGVGVIVALALVPLVSLVCIGGCIFYGITHTTQDNYTAMPTGPGVDQSVPSATAAEDPTAPTVDTFHRQIHNQNVTSKLQVGMNYDDTASILGDEGKKIISSPDGTRFTFEFVVDGKKITVNYRDGKVSDWK